VLSVLQYRVSQAKKAKVEPVVQDPEMAGDQLMIKQAKAKALKTATAAKTDADAVTKALAASPEELAQQQENDCTHTIFSIAQLHDQVQRRGCLEGDNPACQGLDIKLPL